MNRLLILVLACVFPLSAWAHPGKTDKYGGHKCFKDCEEWKLYYAEYHLHDKDGNPIRVAKKPRKHESGQTSELQQVPAPVSAPVVSVVTQTQTVTVYRYVAEENVLPNPYLYLLLILLLLLLILRLTRRRSED